MSGQAIRGMTFDPQVYGSAVAAILQLDGDGQRLMALTAGECASDRARTLIREGAAGMFPRARAPEAAVAGLYLYFDCWAEAHEAAQDIATPEGSYWHAIVHRQEPDAGNAAYWFRQVGSHAIFPALRDAAAGMGFDVGPQWKPEALVELCERARESPGTDLERQAREVQRLEWQLLFDYCAR
jgi:hypothetical protein